MIRIFPVLVAIAVSIANGAFPRQALAQASPPPRIDAAWDSVGHILQSPPAPSPGYIRYNFPRRDIPLTVGDVQVAPALALGTWAGFGGPPGTSMMMGDLVLLSGELKPVLAELAKQNIGVTAIHNHIAGESPQITYVHYHAEGSATALATRISAVIAKSATPRPVTPATAPVTADTARVFTAMGGSAGGRASGNVVQLPYMLVPQPVTMHGMTIVPAMTYGTPVNIQFVANNRIVATGDFSVLAEKVDGVTRALAANGITATAVHTHLVGETPKIYYIHFWADGAVDDVLKGLRAAVDAGRS